MVTGSRPIRNALTIDVEDYFQVSAMAPYIGREEWDSRPCRVERNVERIQALLAERGARATFFTLGWIAERYPALVRGIIAAGHELASHGYAHLRATDQTREQFRSDISTAKKLLEDIGGVEVKGYRAPSFSVGEANPWAHEVMAEVGYRYSSSVYPIRHDHYGMPGAPRFAYRPRGLGLIEIPATTVRLLERNWPASGGGYFRLLPYPVSRWLIGRVNSTERAAAIFYFHPWEIDPAQPRVPGTSLRTRFRHYVHLERMEARVGRLLRDFAWDRVDRVFADVIGAAAGTRPVVPGVAVSAA